MSATRDRLKGPGVLPECPCEGYPTDGSQGPETPAERRLGPGLANAREDLAHSAEFLGSALVSAEVAGIDPETLDLLYLLDGWTANARRRIAREAARREAEAA